MNNYDLIIIGAGPAGLSAALYAARGKLRVLVVDRATAGGQVQTTHQVANYPGFIEPIPGYKLANSMYRQALAYGAEFKLLAEIKLISLEEDTKWIELEDGERYSAPFVVIATGRSPRPLNIPGEAENAGQGLSYCATCDGDFYADKDIFVIGGGNSAMEESLLLLQQVKSITVIHQFDTLQAEKVTAERILASPKVNILWSHEPRSFTAEDGKMTVEVENLKTHERTHLTKDGVFIFVGMVPNNEVLLQTALSLNQHGYITTDPHTLQTNLSGVYAAGDIRDKRQWQITTAVSDGTIAALEIIKQIQ